MAEATMTSDEKAFLAAIVAEPECDAHRLVYADWLDEQGDDRVTCPKCGGGRYWKVSDNPWQLARCEECTDGSVLPTARRERAEFVRVQCELASLPLCGGGDIIAKNHCKVCAAVSTGRKRERELLRANEALWRKAGPCSACGGNGNWHGVVSGGIGNRPCKACHGTGDAGGLLWKFEYVDIPHTSTVTKPPPVTFRRGFPDRVEVPTLADALVEVEEKCPHCDGRGATPRTDQIPVYRCNRCVGGTVRVLRATPWLAAVLAHHPVQEVVALEAKPSDYTGTGDRLCGFWRRWPAERSCDIHPALWHEVANSPDVYQHNGQWIDFATPELAVTALARAIATIGRRGGAS